MRLGLLLAACALLVTGCTTTLPAASPAPSASMPTEETSSPGPASYTADGVPVWFAERDVLPPCPVVQLGGEDVLVLSQTSCLAPDVGGGAELMVRSFTVDSLGSETRYRRVPGQTGLDVMTDESVDTFGIGGWKWTRCPDAVSPLKLGSCTVLQDTPRPVP